VTESAAVDHVRLFVAFPEALVDRPMIYEIVKRFDVVPNIRRANVEPHSGWVILELGGSPEQREAAVAYLEEVGCTVNAMEGDVLEG
jgi:L-aspartate semialdehyde sulfurtransferase ferredoxin